jgi:hypothetical protein
MSDSFAFIGNAAIEGWVEPGALAVVGLYMVLFKCVHVSIPSLQQCNFIRTINSNPQVPKTAMMQGLPSLGAAVEGEQVVPCRKYPCGKSP